MALRTKAARMRPLHIEVLPISVGNDEVGYTLFVKHEDRERRHCPDAEDLAACVAEAVADWQAKNQIYAEGISGAELEAASVIELG